MIQLVCFAAALPSDLRWQRGLLLDVVLRLLTGCDATVWPAAARAAVSLVCALEGVSFHLQNLLFIHVLC